MALDGRNSAVNVGHGLTLGHFADEDLAGLGEGHHRRRGARAFSVDDNGGSPPSRVAMQEFVVPRSIPTARAIMCAP